MNELIDKYLLFKVEHGYLETLHYTYTGELFELLQKIESEYGRVIWDGNRGLKSAGCHIVSWYLIDTTLTAKMLISLVESNDIKYLRYLKPDNTLAFIPRASLLKQLNDYPPHAHIPVNINHDKRLLTLLTQPVNPEELDTD